MHIAIEPSILYLGTPVLLISTVNDDGTCNLAPMSSAFWLGWRCIIGVSASSKTARNLAKTRECVINMPSEGQVAAVNRLALTTGSNPVPDRKKKRGYRYEPDKFGTAGLTPEASETVTALRVRECPIQLEAVVEARHGIADDDPRQRGILHCVELRIQRVHVEESVLMGGEGHRIDPDKWRPLIMSFQEFYGLGQRLHNSRLATIPETSYRTPDVDRARGAG